MLQNCYWLLEDDCIKCIYGNELTNLSEEKECENHNYKCSECGDQAEYKIKGVCLCFDCLSEGFELERHQVTHYTLDGEYIGSDEDISEVIKNISDEIEELE